MAKYKENITWIGSVQNVYAATECHLNIAGWIDWKMELASSSELEVQAAHSMHLVSPQKPAKHPGKRRVWNLPAAQQHQLRSEVVLLMLTSNRNYLTFTEKQWMFFKNCKIPAQLVRPTALQLLLSSYTFIPTLTQCQTLLASCLFQAVVYKRTSFGCSLVEQAFLSEHTLEDLV